MGVMLQANREPLYDYSAEGESLVELLEYWWAVLRQQRSIVVVTTFLATALGALYVYITPPTFTASATIIIDRGKVQAQLGGMSRELPVDPLEIDGQIQLLRSDDVVSAVVKKLSLAQDSEFVGPEVGLPGLINEVRSKFRSTSLPTLAEPDRDQVAAAAVARRLTVSRIGGSVIEIEASSLKPDTAAQIANAFAESYIEDQLRSRYHAAHQAAGWLQDRIRELGEQGALADEAVIQFRAKNNIVATGGRLLSEQQLGELNTQLLLSREKVAEARARLDRIQDIISSNHSDDEVAGTVVETLNNPVIVSLRSQYLELAGREADWSRRFGRDHLAVANLTRQMREIRNAIADELRRIAETYKSDYEIAKQRQINLEKTVGDALSRFQEANQAQIELRQLESSAEAYRGLYKSALQRNKELVQQQSFPGTEARLISRASTPVGSSSPKTNIILVASAAGGALLGLGLGILRVSMDRVFRTSGQAEVTLRANCLTLAPALKRGRSRRKPQEPTGLRKIASKGNMSWEVIERPLSRFAEAIRSIKSVVGLKRQSSTAVLGFTSSLPGEGKSTIATAFALLAARSGARVILVDCDFRHPTLSKSLSPNASGGILDVLADTIALEEVLWTEETTKLAFLPGAIKSPIAHSADILASDKLRTLFAGLRKQYDYIVVDFPPVAPIVDVRSTAGLVDDYVFIVEWGKTKMAVAELALRKAPAVNENLLGVVLNKVDFNALSKYERRRSDYYSDKSYLQYGDGKN